MLYSSLNALEPLCRLSFRVNCVLKGLKERTLANEVQNIIVPTSLICITLFLFITVQ